MMDKGKLIVVSGFSGSGKGTVIRRLMERYSDFTFSVSATTRAPREGEVHGREYFFLDHEAFEDMIREDRLLEHARYVDQYYGTPSGPVDENLSRGLHVILDIEIQGARQVREKRPDAILVFLIPPSARILKERLISRRTETIDKVRKRLARAVEEADGASEYDGIIINDDLDACVDDLFEIVMHPETAAAFREKNLPAALRMKEDLIRILEEDPDLIVPADP